MVGVITFTDLVQVALVSFFFGMGFLLLLLLLIFSGRKK